MFLPYLSFLKLRNRKPDFFFRNLSFVGDSSASISPRENSPVNFCPILINISQMVWFWMVFIFDLFKCSAITFNLITVCLCSFYLIVGHWSTISSPLDWIDKRWTVSIQLSQCIQNELSTSELNNFMKSYVHSLNRPSKIWNICIWWDNHSKNVLKITKSFSSLSSVSVPRTVKRILCFCNLCFPILSSWSFCNLCLSSWSFCPVFEYIKFPVWWTKSVNGTQLQSTYEGPYYLNWNCARAGVDISISSYHFLGNSCVAYKKCCSLTHCSMTGFHICGFPR